MAYDPKKLAYWAEHYRSWQQSGLSQRGYCKQAGLSYSSFDHWRRRARELGGAGSDAPAKQKLTLVPVQLGNSTTTGAGSIELRSPGGWSVIMPMPERDALIRLLSQLP